MKLQNLFEYRPLKDGRIQLFCDGRIVKTIKGTEAKKFLSKTNGLSNENTQMVIAKITGNFKRGNDRLNKE